MMFEKESHYKGKKNTARIAFDVFVVVINVSVAWRTFSFHLARRNRLFVFAVCILT